MAPSKPTHDHSANEMSEMSAFPTFLETDPFPSGTSDSRPASSSTTTTIAPSVHTAAEQPDRPQTRETQNQIPSVTGPVGEPGLPPSRPSSSVATKPQRASVRSSLQPPPSRRGLAAAITSPNGSKRGDADRPVSAVNKTHVPTLTASGFTNPISSATLQAQRGQKVQRQAMPHRYSDASVHTLRDGGNSPLPDSDAPPLPVSRGTDGTQDYHQAVSVASATSTAPLNAKQSQPASLRVQPNLPLPALGPQNSTPRSPAKSVRDSLRLRPSEHHQSLHSEPSSPANGPPKQPLSATDLPRGKGRNYEYYSGNMCFFLGGRLMNAKLKPLCIFTFSLVILPAILFFIFEARYLWHHVSPALPIIFGYIFFLTITSFLRSALSDPGILPRNLHPHPPNPEENDPLVAGPSTTNWVTVKNSKPAASDPEGNQVAGALEVPQKYCSSCKVWRPLRSHHCKDCDGCVETHDHHCAWLNNCVGRRNYRYFFAFVSEASTLSLLLILFSLLYLARRTGGDIGWDFRESAIRPQYVGGSASDRVALAMLIYGVAAFCFPFALVSYHLFLVARGETTREYINSKKFLKKDRYRPFALSSWLSNWHAVLLRPRMPSYMQFKEPYHEGDLRMGNTTTRKERKAENVGRYSVQQHEMQQLPTR